MRVSERDRSRLAALIAIVKPVNSISARLDALNDDQREHYDWFKSRCEQWMRRYPDGEAYEKHLDGYGPRLRADISVSLYGQQRTIPIAADDNAAMQIYKEFCDERL